MRGAQDDVPYGQRPMIACYPGTVRRDKGVVEAAAAVALLPPWLDARLVIAGDYSPPSYREDVERAAAGRLEYLGYLSAEDVRALLGRSRVMLALYHPSPNHVNSSPHKVFEGMAAGLPVLGSDLPALRETVGSHGCGILVDPRNPGAIAEALQWLFTHPDQAAEMGGRGLATVRAHYSWDQQARELLRLYHRLAGYAREAIRPPLPHPR